MSDISDIEYIFHIESELFQGIKEDIEKAEKEKKREESELRPWFAKIVNFTDNIWAGIKKDRLYISIWEIVV